MLDALLRSLFDAAVQAADPARVVGPHLPPPPKGRTVVAAFGKAAASMARAVEDHWPGGLEGLAVTRYGHAVPCKAVEVVEAGHPLPDAAGEDAARRILALAAGVGGDDLFLCLISGGGSALFALPAPGLELSDKQDLSAQLLKSGASISEINCVRKHLSGVKGGRLAAAAFPAKVVALAISDVPGDDPAVIASGPTVADASTLEDARAVLERYRLAPSAVVARALGDAANETPKPGDARLDGCETKLIATPDRSLDAAAGKAREAGLEPVMLGGGLEGESRHVARAHADLARDAAQARDAAPAGRVLISGGETTVTISGSGRGGPNAEYLLALAIALDGHPGIHAIACDTDGIDGSEDNAGAIVRPDTLARARAMGLDAGAMLAGNDAYGFFAALGDLVVTGPTLTNVNDFRAILVEPAAHKSDTNTVQ